VIARVTSSERMVRSRRLVERLLGAAREHADCSSDEVAATLVGVAATVSRRRHMGQFANQDMEDLLLELSARVPEVAVDGAVNERRTGLHRGSALYVMTNSYAHGGHSRLVGRWIAMRPELESSLVLTAAGSAEPPPDIVDAIQRSGGRVYRLEGSAMHRASALRSLARRTETVVLAPHENDIVPPLALASATWRPPVVFLNHADHVFWVGSAIADVVVSLRPAAADLAVRRRGIAEGCSLQVALPLPASERTRAIGDAKRALCIPPSAKLLVTVGWAYKFAPLAGRDLVADLDEILARPDVHLIAVGPTGAQEPWASASRRYGDRVRALGRRDAHDVLEAADIYLESFPIASLTATLEAGMLGVPAVGLSLGAEMWPPILREDDPSLADHVFTDARAYRAHIGRLLEDDVARVEAGRSLKARVEQHHGVDAWEARVAQVQNRSRDVAASRVRRSERILGTPGLEDDTLAGVIADNEDRVNRREMHYAREPGSVAGDALELLNCRMEQLDHLILGAAAPGRKEYAAAMRIARSVRPVRLRFRARLSAAVRKAQGRR
jgi:Glycosyl transferases group 1